MKAVDIFRNLVWDLRNIQVPRLVDEFINEFLELLPSAMAAMVVILAAYAATEVCLLL
jgi:hypothetical protein